MSSLFNDLKSKVIGIADSLTPVLKESKFRETGYLTPEEFVAAGDFLVHHCPTWQWGSGDKAKAKDYLPKDKQFLFTKNVPCSKRCKHLMDVKANMEKVVEEDSGDGGWVDTHFFSNQEDKNNADAIIDPFEDLAINKSQNKENQETEEESLSNDENDEDEGEALDIETYDMDNDDDEATVTVFKPVATTLSTTGDVANSNSTTIQTRTYDLNITYDNYYRTPRMWLCGYDENQRPLSVEQMYEDISQDHANKTVTFEAHPHIPGTQMASIHPCRHAEVMKKLINMVADSGKELEVYNYLMVFLKFVQAVIPTIEYDFTRNVLI